jgi:hypothetical protein
VAGHTGQKVRANAEARQIAAEFGLGRPVKVWRRRSKATEWVLGLGFLIGLPVVLALLPLATHHGAQQRLPVWYAVALGTVVALPMVIAVRSGPPVLYEFEGGVANVSTYRRRVTVVRWAELSSVSEDTYWDEGVQRSHGYLLRDRAGRTVKLGKRARELAARAERLLAARLSQPTH